MEYLSRRQLVRRREKKLTNTTAVVGVARLCRYIEYFTAVMRQRGSIADLVLLMMTRVDGGRPEMRWTLEGGQLWHRDYL